MDEDEVDKGLRGGVKQAQTDITFGMAPIIALIMSVAALTVESCKCSGEAVFG